MTNQGNRQINLKQILEMQKSKISIKFCYELVDRKFEEKIFYLYLSPLDR